MGREEFRRHVGRSNFLVWQKLLNCRTKKGLTLATRVALGRLPGYEVHTQKRVQTALRRLAKLGLVENLGWKCRAGTHALRVRRVLGATVLHNGQPWVSLPREVAARVLSARPHGGPRNGAGRPPIKGDILISRSALASDLSLNPNYRGEKTIKMSPLMEPHSGGNQDVPLILCSSSSSKGSNSLGGSTNGPRSGGGHSSSNNCGTGDGGGSDSLPGIGTTLRGSGTPRRAHLGPVLPPFPGASQVPLCVVPNPPALDPSGSEEVWAETLARAYRGAAESRFGVRSFVLARGDIRRSKLYGTLVACARALVRHEIPPAAWAAFSMDVWKRYGNGKAKLKPPPVRWVFTEKRVEDRKGWYRAEGGASGGQIIFGDAHKDLMRRYTAMQRDIGHATVNGMVGVAQARQIVDSHFPDGLYDRLVDEAKAEVDDNKARLRRLVERGEWVWE